MPEPAPQTLLDHALAYARFGFFIFPTHDVLGGRCSCGHACSSPGKHPRTAHGLLESTRDEGTIRAWWGAWPSANIAVDCGKSGIVVVDVDVKKGAQGRASIAWVVERYTGFRSTLVAGSPSGGLHYYFSGRTGTSHSRLRPGLDVQSTGAYVLLPPSVAFSRYDEARNPIPGSQAPYHWINNFSIQAFPITEESGYDFSAPAAAETQARSAIPYGEHRNALLRLAFSSRRVLGLDAKTTVGLLKNFIASGALENYDPKHPFTDRDLEGMVRSLAPHVAQSDVPASVNVVGAMVDADAVLAENTVPRQVVIPGLVQRGELHVFYGADGTKKTTIAAYLLALISRQGRDVGVFMSEDQPRDFLLKFLQAGGDQSRFFYFDARRFQGDFLLPKHKAYLEQLVQSRSWGCIYFDSINDYKSMDGRLNAADEARSMFGPLQQLAQTYDVTVLCTLHTNARDVLEGSRQIRAKARVVAHVENPKVDTNEDGYDFSRTFDANLAAMVTTDKFSRGVSRQTFNFYFDIFPAVHPKTGEADIEIQPDGTRTVKELIVCTGHEVISTVAARPVGRPRAVEEDVLREQIAGLLAATPNISSNAVAKHVKGDRNAIMRIVKELRA
jgi:hypothetical protein